MRSSKIVFSMPFSSIVMVLARTSKIGYGLTVRFWNLLYVLPAKDFADDLEAVVKGSLLKKI